MSVIIVYESYGDTHLYAGTKENALSIYNMLKEQNEISEEAIEISENTDKYIIPDYRFQRAIVEILDNEVGFKTRWLRSLLTGVAKKNEEDTRPEIEVSKEMKQELALWLMENKVSIEQIKSWSYYELNKRHPEDTFEFLAAFKARIPNNKEIRWVDDSDLELSDKIKIIDKNVWKDTATEDQIVNYIVSFCGEVMQHSRDTKIHTEKVRETFA